MGVAAMAAPTRYTEMGMVMKKKMRIFINQFRLWHGKVAAVTEWYQDGNTIHLKIQRCGLFKTYKGIPFYCDIDIDPALIIQSPK